MSGSGPHSPQLRRTPAERFRDSYAMFRVALARLMRGERPRLLYFLFR